MSTCDVQKWSRNWTYAKFFQESTTNFSFVSPFRSSVYLSWDVSDDGGERITRYYVEYQITGSQTTQVAWSGVAKRAVCFSDDAVLYIMCFLCVALDLSSMYSPFAMLSRICAFRALSFTSAICILHARCCAVMWLFCIVLHFSSMCDAVQLCSSCALSFTSAVCIPHPTVR